LGLILVQSVQQQRAEALDLGNDVQGRRGPLVIAVVGVEGVAGRVLVRQMRIVVVVGEVRYQWTAPLSEAGAYGDGDRLSQNFDINEQRP
jgi:hypothetical protein